MKTVYIIRHGETLFNLKGLIQGTVDSPLTDKGIKQAQEAKKHLEGIVFDGVFSSTSERSIDTANILSDIKVQAFKELKERNFGKMEGENEFLNPEVTLDAYDEFFIPLGGESSLEVQTRFTNKLIEIMNDDSINTALIVSHAGVMWNFLSHHFEKDLVDTIRSNNGLKNCSILKFKYNPQNESFAFIEVVND